MYRALSVIYVQYFSICCPVTLQWNLWIKDTFGTSHFREVVLIWRWFCTGYACIQEYFQLVLCWEACCLVCQRFFFVAPCAGGGWLFPHPFDPACYVALSSKWVGLAGITWLFLFIQISGWGWLAAQQWQQVSLSPPRGGLPSPLQLGGKCSWGEAELETTVRTRVHCCLLCTTLSYILRPGGKGRWREHHGPPGIYIGACASSGQCLYCFGGLAVSAWHNSLHQLDTSSATLKWTQLTTPDSSSGPMKKIACGMVSYYSCLVLFGGYGYPCGPTQPGAEFIRNAEMTDGRGWSNELHVFDLTEGEAVCITASV